MRYCSVLVEICCVCLAFSGKGHSQQGPDLEARIPIWIAVPGTDIGLPGIVAGWGAVRALSGEKGRHTIVVIDRAAESFVVMETGGRGLTIRARSRLSRPIYVPAGIALTADGRIVVVDAASSMVHVFRLNPLGRHEQSFPIIRNPEGFCLVGDTVFVAGLSSGKLVHAYRLETGDLMSEFGRAFGDGEPLTSEIVSRGQVGCTANGLVMVSSDTRGELRAFTTRGVLRWSKAIRSYHRVELVSDGSTYRTIIPSAGFNETLRFFELDGGQMALQIGFNSRTRGSQQPIGSAELITTLIVSLEDGIELARVSNSPRILVGGDGIFLGMAADSGGGHLTLYRLKD